VSCFVVGNSGVNAAIVFSFLLLSFYPIPFRFAVFYKSWLRSPLVSPGAVRPARVRGGLVCSVFEGGVKS